MASMSLTPLEDDEYEDGEVYPINFNTGIGKAIAEEEWLNISDDHRNYWLAVMRSNRIRFVGTVLSKKRKQVEITIVFRDAQSGMVNFCITLEDIDRFY